ncbi:hypothetical protein F5Y12DRAFT_766843 [Xylaria sp. FL1777]|nr:hypothetical protein F5Y12DRAFT_766843 [Xylaria sp. FL1777]
MPRKVRLPGDAAQNRENQQRSRARRRAYLASLEARVREFERRDMRATLEMQHAAREVAWTNERLMELLAARGMSRGQVDEFLSRCKEESDSYSATGANLNSGSREISAAGAIDTATSQTQPAGYEGVENADERNDAVPDSLKQSTDIYSSSRALTTSCDAAAGIIAGFHGHGDVLRARIALGCGDAVNCHVKNTQLFQLMDETGYT